MSRDQPIIAMVDCNNFYCSCERVFDPTLANVPVAVLSNNDGCVIARSQEVKDAGIKMGTPAFKVRDQLKDHGVRVFSSNYTLYGDMSRRVMDVLDTMAPRIEVYSIDEAFLDLTGFDRDTLNDYGREIKRKVQRWTGIPVGVGIAPTKTLAKLANYYAKKHPVETGGVKTLLNSIETECVLNWAEVGDVWGVGSASIAKLNALGIYTAADLASADPKVIRGLMTVVGHRTLLELRGTPCLDLEIEPPIRKGVASTRSFGRTVTELDELNQAIAGFIDRAAFKLRRESLVAERLEVFIKTDRFRTDAKQYANAASMQLPVPSADTGELTTYGGQLVRRIYRPGFAYKKAGVFLTELRQRHEVQTGLFDHADRDRRDRLLKAFDQINHRFGSGSIGTAARSLERQPTWQMKREHLSPAYTTRWSELPVVRAPHDER